MTHDTPNEYGCKGCSCFKAESVADGVYYGQWMPNAGCRYHGVLADYQAPRMDTGVYTLDLKKYEEGLPAGPPEECPPGVHSMFDFCPGGCLEPYDEDDCPEHQPPCDYDGMYGEHGHIDNADGEPVCLVGPEVTTEYEETGVLATVRSWVRRFGDWLDPHAAHRRDHRNLLAEWRRHNADLDGGESGDQAG